MKYMGSKSRIAKHIVPILQKFIDDNNIHKYVEPFVGGANIIDKIKCDERYGFDKNRYLIALLNHVKNDGQLYDVVSKQLYNDARNCFRNGGNEFCDWELGNIGFLASYNGRFFDGGYAKSGYEKGKIRNYYEESKKNIIKQSKKLNGISFQCCDYKECIELPFDNNMLIYCDPPYSETKQYKNSFYFDYKEFWETVRKWSKYNIVIISELKAPSDFECIWKQEVSRSIKAKDKRKVTEKLFMYRGEK